MSVRMIQRVGIAAVLVLAIAVSLLVLLLREPAVSQPIAFSHFKHTQDLGLDCALCHQYAQTQAHSGLPDEETCAICHRVALGTTLEAAELTRLIDEGEPIRFNKLFGLADHVFYTHRRHVGIAEIECETCHGAISETETPPTRPLVKVTMGFCLDCHQEQQQTVDCNACHK